MKPIPVEANRGKLRNTDHVSKVESQSKPGIKMVDPEPCKEIQRLPQLFLAGIVPY